MAHCFANKEHGYCKHMKQVEVDPKDGHKIVERSRFSYSCAWCVKHDCPCSDKNYYCSDIELVRGYWNDDMEWVEEPV